MKLTRRAARAKMGSRTSRRQGTKQGKRPLKPRPRSRIELLVRGLNA